MYVATANWMYITLKRLSRNNEATVITGNYSSWNRADREQGLSANIAVVQEADRFYLIRYNS